MTLQTERPTRRRPDRGARGWLVVFAVVVLVIAAVAVVGLVRAVGGGDDDRPTSAATPQPSPASEPSAPTPSTAAAVADVRAPVYYVGDGARGPRLFRELVALQGVTPAQELQQAVQAAVSRTPTDPDYRTVWPGGTTVTVTGSGPSGVSVDLRGSTQALAAAPSQGGTIGVQAVVHTVDAVLRQAAPVTFTIDGQAAPSVLGVDTSAPIGRADPLEVQAPVRINAPADGATVGSAFTVRGVAATFEANVVWELKQGSKVVQQGHTTARECCTPSPYRFSVTGVPAGSYTLVVHDSDESGEGGAVNQDTKAITVR